LRSRIRYRRKYMFSDALTDRVIVSKVSPLDLGEIRYKTTSPDGSFSHALCHSITAAKAINLSLEAVHSESLPVH